MIYQFISDNNDNYIIGIGAPDSDEEPEDHDKVHDNGEISEKISSAEILVPKK